MSMKKTTLLIVLCAAMQVQAQEGVTLKEVVVDGTRTVQLADRQVIYPTRQQREAATSGYSLLQQLGLPHIRIDAAAHTIAALNATGTIEVRINDVAATKDDLLSLDMQAVEAVEFIDHPDVRYGEGVAYVINIKVKHPVSGYALGADLSQALTHRRGDGSLYAKWNMGRSEVGASYSADYSHDRGTRSTEHTTYAMADGTVADVLRSTLGSDERSRHHALQLSYSLADSLRVFQARLNHSQPIGTERTVRDRLTAVNGLSSAYADHNHSRTKRPSLDLYFHRRLPHRQELTANVVGTYIDTRDHTERNELTPYIYHTRGKTYTLWSETVYENHLPLFNVSAGAQWIQRYSDNVYEGAADAHNRMHTSGQNLFGQLSGRLWQQLSYVAALGVSRRYFRQADNRQTFLLCRPKLSLGLPFGHGWRLKYDFEIAQHMSQIALISQVSIKQNAFETLVGNPDLKPNRVTSHELRLSYTKPRLMLELKGYCRMNFDCNMEKTVRLADTDAPADIGTPFLNTQANQKGCHFFVVQPFVQCDIVPKRLSLTAYAGFYRYFNYGDDYTHTYNAVNGAAWLQAYLGRFTLMAYADNGYNWMEGENRGHQAPFWQLSATCRVSSQLQLSLRCSRPFSAHPADMKTDILNRYIHRHYVSTSASQGNLLMLNLTWNMSHGRQYRDINRTMNHRDTETGILK